MIDDAITVLTRWLASRVPARRSDGHGPLTTRWHRTSPAPERPVREPTPQPRDLSAVERTEVLAVLNEERFVDLAPGEAHAILLDNPSLTQAGPGYVVKRRQIGEMPRPFGSGCSQGGTFVELARASRCG